MPTPPRGHRAPPLDAVIAALCTTFTGAVSLLAQASSADLAADAYAGLAVSLTAVAAARGGVGTGIASAIAGALATSGLIALRGDDGTPSLIRAFATFAALAVAIVAGNTFRTRTDSLLGQSDAVRADADALSHARTYLAATQQIAHIGTWETPITGPDFPRGPLRCSEELYHIYAFDPTSQIDGEAILSRLPADDRARVEQEFASAVSQRRPYDLEHRILRPDGSSRWVHERGTVDEREDGAKKFLGTVQDITELMEARHELEQAEARWRSMVTTAPDYILTTDLDRRYTYINHPAPGFTWDDFKDKRLEDMVPEEYRRIVVAAMARARTTGQTVTYETAVAFPSGTRRIVSRARTLLEDGEPTGFIIISTDVTEEREAMERIRAQESRFRRLLENSWDAVILTDGKGHVIDASPSIVKVLGYTTAEFAALEPRSFVIPEDLPGYAALAKDILDHAGKPVRGALRLRHKDGASRWIELVAVNRLDEPEVQAVITNIRDVTAQRHAESESRQKERFARAIFDKTVDINSIMTAEGTVIEINDAGAGILGYSVADMVGKNGFSLILEEDRDEAVAAFRRRLEHPDTAAQPTRYRVRTASGKIIWLESVGINLLDDPTIRGILLISRDITDRVRADEERRVIDAKFKALIEHSFDLVLLVAADHRVTFASPSFHTILGYRPEELVGADSFLLVHPEDIKGAAGTLEAAARSPGGTASRRVRVRHKNGSWRTVDTVAANLLHVPEVAALVLNSRDVTEQVAAAEDAERQRRYVQAIFDNSIDGISIYGLDGIARMVSASSERLFGYSSEELTGRPMPELMHPDDLPKAKEAFSALVARPDKTMTYTYRMRRKDGEWGWFESVARNMLADDAIRGILINTRDVTETMRSREEVAAHEARFRGMVEHMTEGVHLTNDKGVITYATPAITRLFGYPLDEFIGKAAETFVHPDDATRIDRLTDVLGTTHAPSAPYEARIKKRDGTYTTIEAVAVNLLDDPSIRSMVYYTRDISDRKRAEARVRELDALKNKFIQVVSHQFRTPLNVVRWNLETLLAEELGAVTAVQKEFLRITYQANSEVIERIHDLLTALDIEEQRIVLRRESISLETLWNGVNAEMQKACVSRGLTCTHTPPTVPIPPVDADPEKIRVVFAKLADNATSYTPSGGTVHTSLTTLDGMIRFEITDTGIGVPAEEQRRIFERFYRASNSSVQKQDSSGLGLSIAKYFVEQHGGRIGMRSIEGKGSTFWFELPPHASRA